MGVDNRSPEAIAYDELRRRVRAAGVSWERDGYQELVRMLDARAAEIDALRNEVNTMRTERIGFVRALGDCKEKLKRAPAASDVSTDFDLFELLRHVSGLKIPPDQLKAAAGFLADLAEARYAFQ